MLEEQTLVGRDAKHRVEYKREKPIRLWFMSIQAFVGTCGTRTTTSQCNQCGLRPIQSSRASLTTRCQGVKRQKFNPLCSESNSNTDRLIINNLTFSCEMFCFLDLHSIKLHVLYTITTSKAIIFLNQLLQSWLHRSKTLQQQSQALTVCKSNGAVAGAGTSSILPGSI